MFQKCTGYNISKISITGTVYMVFKEMEIEKLYLLNNIGHLLVFKALELDMDSTTCLYHLLAV